MCADLKYEMPRGTTTITTTREKGRSRGIRWKWNTEEKRVPAGKLATLPNNFLRQWRAHFSWRYLVKKTTENAREPQLLFLFSNHNQVTRPIVLRTCQLKKLSTDKLMHGQFWTAQKALVKEHKERERERERMSRDENTTFMRT